MIKKWYMGTLGLSMLAGMVGVLNGRTTETVSTTVCKEIINGITFVSKSESVDGVLKHAWTVNGRHVEPEEFEEEVLDAEKEERRREREKAQQQALRTAQFKEKILQNGYCKLLEQSLAAVERELEAVQTLKLEPFLHFNMRSFATREQFNAVSCELVPQARACVEHFDMQQAKIVVQKLDGASEHLRTLVQDSVEYAISHCDDPKLLKELLVNVERM